MLEISNLVMRFGGVTALDRVGFTVADNEICGLIGPNGAGKTSLFNCITGFYKPQVGRLALHHDSGPVLLERLDDHRISSTARVAPALP